ncbi:ferredoxin [Parafrankia sp. FMc2]|uniref:ferredoxin n=1 Tax=Parafrankia sp. FMc2 TaxID=3233196 RepID=UPI0034D6E618
MKFSVDLTQCENHSQCSFAAPNLFDLDDEGATVVPRQARRGVHLGRTRRL